MSTETALQPNEDREDDQLAVRVNVTKAQAEELLRREGLDFGDRPNIRPNSDGSGALDLFLSRAEIAALEAEGFRIEVGANLSASARHRQADIGQGDRFEGGRIPPRGLGRKIGGKSRGNRPGQTP